LIYLLAAGLTVWVYRCHPAKKNNTPALAYLNLADSVKYVGMDKCKFCHQDKFDSFIHTGMGQSFGPGHIHKTSAKFSSHALVYDSLTNLYYHPYLLHDSLYIREFRIVGKDTVHNRVQKVDYIIGSGQHTNSHIYNASGYLFQAPITFYTQQGIWDLAPGFAGGQNNRFNRIIGKECMTCHNSLPKMVVGSENKFTDVPQGIACERCHGPGELHINAMLSGQITDTSRTPDYSIVNPRRLPRDLQMNVCQRCHLQGISVLKNDRDYDQFKPGMPLSDVMDIYLPEYSGPQTQFIMASQAHRLTKSNCYLRSEMTCLTCHNPHISVKNTNKKHWDISCQKCHTNKPCTAPLAARDGKYCYECHMPSSGSIDIPHVKITDHFIRKPPTPQQWDIPENFNGLHNVISSQYSPTSLATAYLKFFEEFLSQPAMLDSAFFHISNIHDARQKLYALLHYFYLKKDFPALRNLSHKLPASSITDAWTAYRCGEAFLEAKEYPQALPYLLKSTDLLPYQQDFKAKLGFAHQMNGNTSEAKRIFENILLEQPQNHIALNNLGYILLSQANFKLAKEYIFKSVDLDPDYIAGLQNKLAIQHIEKDEKGIRLTALHLLLLDPDNVKAKSFLK